MKKLFYSLILLLLLTPLSTFAEQGGTAATYSNAPGSFVVGNGNIKYVPLEPIPGFVQTGELNFGELLSSIFKVLIVIGGFIAIGAFVYAGIVYMTSEVVGSKSDAKKRLRASLLGLFLLIASWLILYTINPQLVTFSGALNPVKSNYQFIGSQQNSTCIGTSCLSQAQKNAVSNAQQPGGTASQADVNTAIEAQRQQEAACVSSGGSIIPSGAMGLSGCRGLGFTTCSVMAGANSGATPPSRCGMK